MPARASSPFRRQHAGGSLMQWMNTGPASWMIASLHVRFSKQVAARNVFQRVMSVLIERDRRVFRGPFYWKFREGCQVEIFG